MTITLYSWVNHKLRREHPNGVTFNHWAARKLRQAKIVRESSHIELGCSCGQAAVYLVDLKVAPESLVRSMVALIADD